MACDDSGWTRAVDLGVLGSGPWGRLVFSGEDLAKRFRVPEGFMIETAAQGSVTGSVVAFTFDPDQSSLGVAKGGIKTIFARCRWNDYIHAKRQKGESAEDQQTFTERLHTACGPSLHILALLCRNLSKPTARMMTMPMMISCV